MGVLKACSVLVTGSNRGIGFGLVKQLAKMNNCPEWIFATCRDPEGPRAQELKQFAAKHKGVKIVTLDTHKSSSIKSAAAQVTEQLKGAGLNLLINNAGIVKPTLAIDSETAEDMSEVYTTNVIGHLEVSQAFFPLLKKASKESSEKGMSCSRAAIVNMSSEAGSIQNMFAWDLGHIVSYRCSKAALNMLTRCQALAYSDDKILCVALHPGWVQTDMGNAGGNIVELKALAAKHRGVEVIPLDTSKTSSIKSAAARVTEQLKGAGLNLLINNAGIVKPTPVLDTETAEAMSEVYRTNVIGPLEVSQAFLPLLKRASQESTENGMSCSRAAIINVSSEGGSIQNMYAWDLGHMASYRCSKAALNMLTRCQGLAYADDKILCVALHPGWVQTDMGNFGNRLAPMKLDASVQSILNTLARLSEKHTATFVNWEGETVPW